MIGETVGGGLGRWLEVHSLGRKPRSVEFNVEIHRVTVANWPGALNAAPGAVTPELLLEFGRRVTRYCPSRWNAMVSAVRFAVPHAKPWLQFRELKSKERPSVSPERFAELCGELDRAERSHGGLVVRFLAQTALRINSARCAEWAHVLKDCIYLPPSVMKNGRPLLVPFIPGTVELLDKLRAVAKGKRQKFILPQRECKTALLSACARLGLPRLTHHDFRHLFITRAIEGGVDAPTLARWVGHGDGGALLMKRYFHLLDPHSRRMAKRVKI
jgi:integrase